MTKPKRLAITRTITFYDYDNLQSLYDQVVAAGGDPADTAFEDGCEFESGYVTFCTPETDKEYEERMRRAEFELEKSRQDATKKLENERKEYERLKKKFGEN